MDRAAGIGRPLHNVRSMLVRDAQLPAFAIALTLSCSPAFTDEPYRAPRTADRHPDLQGVWVNSSLTPLERPDYIKTLLISDAEAARIVDAHVRRSEDRTKPTEPSEWLDQRQLEPIRG